MCVDIFYLRQWHLGSLTAANWVSFDLNVFYSSCWGYSIINTLKTIMPPLCLIKTWHNHRHHASAASGSAFACHALSSSLKTPPAYAWEHWAIGRNVCSHRSPVHLIANDAGRGVLRRHDDAHIAAVGCAECIFVSSFKLASRRSAYVLSKAQTWADGSGGMLAGAQRGQRTAPPTASDWGDAQCVRDRKRTRLRQKEKETKRHREKESKATRKKEKESKKATE